MKTIARTLMAGLVASVILGTAATSHAQNNARSLFNQVAKSYQGQARNTFQIRPAMKQIGKIAGGNHGGGHGPGFGFPPVCITPPSHCRPEPPCGGGYCPPPRPCYVYLVYYYDCHCGWKLYGSYHRSCDAHHAVEMLQNQGYRAYYQQSAR